MAEEQRCQESHRLCANNCGFFGSPATLDLCSKCYRDLRLKEEQAASAKVAVERSLSQPPSPPAAPVPSFPAPPPSVVASGSTAGSSVTAVPAPDSSRRPNRCYSCQKRVGLTGFRCRCGETYCGEHRYPERHACSFDYKTAGREAIARSNPVVQGDKLHKI